MNHLNHLTRTNTALLLVDMQRIWALPGRDPSYPERDGEHYFYKRLSTTVIPNQVRLLKAARAAGIEVVHTIIQSLTLDGRDRSLDHKLTPIHIPPDLEDGLPVTEVAPVGDEILLPKTSSGVFNSTNIDYVLRNLAIECLIVGGILTDQCVDMSIRDGADRSYRMICVPDCCAAPTAERHASGLSAFSGYCEQVESELLVGRFAEWAQDSGSQRPNAS